LIDAEFKSGGLGLLKGFFIGVIHVLKAEAEVD